jgi:hypothetical protein
MEFDAKLSRGSRECNDGKNAAALVAALAIRAQGDDRGA